MTFAKLSKFVVLACLLVPMLTGAIWPRRPSGAVDILLMAEEDFETDATACDDAGYINVSATNGSPDCNSAGLAGTYSALVKDSAELQIIRFESVWTANAIAVCDFLLEFNSEPTSNRTSDIWRMQAGSTNSGLNLRWDTDGGAGDAVINLQSQSNTNGVAELDITALLTVTHQVRIAYCATAAACDTLGITDSLGDGDGGEVWMSVGTGAADWDAGTVWNTTVDGTTTATIMDGFYLLATRSGGDFVVDYNIDNISCCSDIPADPTQKCS